MKEVQKIIKYNFESNDYSKELSIEIEKQRADGYIHCEVSPITFENNECMAIINNPPCITITWRNYKTS